MRTKLLLFLFMLMPLVVSAQLKVTSEGKVFIQKPTTYNNAILNIGTISGSPYETDDDFNSGIHVQNTDSLGMCFFTGIMSETNKKNTAAGHSIGIWGLGMGAAGYKNIGVLGTIHPDQSGACVVGCVDGGTPPPFIGTYAGYFFGHAYVDGDLTTYGIYNLSDMRLKSDVTSLDVARDLNETPLTKLAGLDVFSYHLKHPNQESTVKESKHRSWVEKDAKRLHYGVSAQDLQKIFPDLVREGQDGYLTVNYTEMVPILLHCIKELKQEIEVLKASTNGEMMSRTSLFSGGGIQDETANVGQVSSVPFNGASLMQNTPNPFSERTVIRFTLPENAQNAYIYIFDMQGKMQKQIPVNASMQSVTVNGYELSAGMYIYSLVVNGKEVDTKRMILSK